MNGVECRRLDEYHRAFLRSNGRGNGHYHVEIGYALSLHYNFLYKGSCRIFSNWIGVYRGMMEENMEATIRS